MAVDILRSLPAGSETQVGDSLMVLSQSAYYQGRLDEAERLAAEALSIYERLVGPEDPRIGESRFALAWSQSAMGRFEAGRRGAEKLLEMSRRTFGEDHIQTGTAIDLVAHTAVHRGDYETAVATWRGLIDLAHQVSYENHPRMGNGYVSLAAVLMEQRDFRGALRLTDDALALHRNHPVPNVDVAMRMRAGALHALGRLQDADRWFREALATIQRERPRSLMHRGLIQAEYGLLLLDRGDVTGSEALLREAFAATRQIRPEGHPNAVLAALALARWHMRTGTFEEAERLSIEGDGLLAADYGTSHPTADQGARPDHRRLCGLGPARAGRAYRRERESATAQR